MPELDERIRALIDEAATPVTLDEVRRPSAYVASQHLRAHGRRTLLHAGAIAVVVAMLILGFVALRPTGSTHVRSVATSPSTVGTAGKPSAVWPKRLVMERGDFKGWHWEYVAYTDHQGRHCLDVELPTSASGGCGFALGGSRSLGLAAGGSPVTGLYFVAGLVGEEIAQVRVNFGASSQVTTPARRHAALPFDYVVVPLAGEPRTAEGLSEDGSVLATMTFQTQPIRRP